MIKFIKSFFSKKTSPVEQPKVEEYVAPVTVAEPVVEPVSVPEVSNPIIETTVITTKETKVVVAPTVPEKKKRKSKQSK